MANLGLHIERETNVSPFLLARVNSCPGKFVNKSIFFYEQIVNNSSTSLPTTTSPTRRRTPSRAEGRPCPYISELQTATCELQPERELGAATCGGPPRTVHKRAAKATRVRSPTHTSELRLENFTNSQQLRKLQHTATTLVI